MKLNKILKIHKSFWLLPILCILFIAHMEARADELYRYLERIGEDSAIYNWNLFEEKDRIKIISVKNKEIFYNVCDPSGSTHEWRVKKAGIDITAKAENQILTIKGNLQGEEINKEFGIQSLPWYQPLSFSLRNFLMSKQPSVVFWTIRPDNLSPVKMRATKENIERIMINGEEIEAQKVRVSLNGMLSIFWHCHYWFSTDEGVFLKYEGSRGLSSKNKMIIQLVETAVTPKDFRLTFKDENVK